MAIIERMHVGVDEVREKLQEVKDPEIDTVSIVELGMVEVIEVVDGHVVVEILPTFLGCPALPIIQKNIEQALWSLGGVVSINVKFIHSPPWTSDRISDAGRNGLKEFGIAPPPRFEEDGSWHVDCPFCSSTYVTMENLFGPTACRSILYCKGVKIRLKQ